MNQKRHSFLGSAFVYHFQYCLVDRAAQFSSCLELYNVFGCNFNGLTSLWVSTFPGTSFGN